MERLLNLLQEFYWENRKFSNDNWLLTMTNWVENLSGAYAQTYIISLMGGFIKWLAENEKIEYRKIIEKEIEVWFKLVRIKDYPNKIMEEDVEELLMLLSIQDEPIRFLCEILK